MAGGTEIFIRGQNLFVGGTRKVMINNLDCPVDSEKRYDKQNAFFLLQCIKTALKGYGILDTEE